MREAMGLALKALLLWQWRWCRVVKPSIAPVFAQKFAIFVVATAFGAGFAHADTVADDRGMAVTFNAVPLRVVSLLPALTESLCALGQCDRLVGVDRYSNHPASVQKLPKAGGGLDPNIEAIVALRPDLVLLATSARASERLESLGIKVLALEPKTHADVLRVLQVLDRVFQTQRAAGVWQTIQTGLDAAAQSLPADAAQLRVYFEVSPTPHAASEASFVGETLHRLRVKNIVPGSFGPFPQISPEFVVRADPDLILASLQNTSGMATRPGWAQMRAIVNRQVCGFTAAQSDVLVRPGPRMAQAASLMADCLRGKTGAAPPGRVKAQGPATP
jgi:iron complex transport system substrate-binding protein